jgi:hypothetical protein
MAEQHMDEETQRHMATWQGFGKLMFWSVIGIVVVLLLMRAFIVHPTAV